MILEISRRRFLSGNYVYPRGLVKLKMTKHCKDRLTERGAALNVVPTVVRATKENIYSARVNGKYVVSIVIRLLYKPGKFIFLCYNPFDGALKTVWFNEIVRKNSIENTKQAV